MSTKIWLEYNEYIDNNFQLDPSIKVTCDSSEGELSTDREILEAILVLKKNVLNLQGVLLARRFKENE